MDGALEPDERPGDGAPLIDRSRPRGATAALVSVALLVSVVLLPLGLLVHAGWAPLADLDQLVSETLVVSGRGAEVDVLRALTVPGAVLARAVVLLPLVVWFTVTRRWQLVAFTALAGLAVSPVNAALKIAFDRDRPVFEDTNVVSGLSFPSGHSSGAAALAIVLVVVAWPALTHRWQVTWLVLTAVGTAVVGYTRIALGAHYLSDVVAGWSVGVAWVLALAVACGVWPGQAAALRPRDLPQPVSPPGAARP